MQTPVIGAIADDGTPVAFPVAMLEPSTTNGTTITHADITIASDDPDYTATSATTGQPLTVHQALLVRLEPIPRQHRSVHPRQLIRARKFTIQG